MRKNNKGDDYEKMLILTSTGCAVHIGDSPKTAGDYFCYVVARNGFKYEGTGNTRTQAEFQALDNCGIFCKEDYVFHCD